MCGQELRRRLQAVDPDLKVVSRGHHRGTKREETNWEKAGGVVCSSCGREVFRSREGLCMPCWEKAHEVEVRDGTGITNWLPINIIQQITHQARKGQ